MDLNTINLQLKGICVKLYTNTSIINNVVKYFVDCCKIYVENRINMLLFSLQQTFYFKWLQTNISARFRYFERFSRRLAQFSYKSATKAQRYHS